GVRNVGDVGDPRYAEPVVAHGVDDALRAAVGTPVQRLTGYEQQLAVHRDVALRPGAHERLVQPRPLGVGDVPYLDAGEVALNDVGPDEREVGVDELKIPRGPWEEVRGGRRGRDQADVPGGLGRIHPPGAEPDARVGARRRRGHVDLRRGTR